MVFFGIDPGTLATGYGVIETKGNTVLWRDSGAITQPKNASLPDKLSRIFTTLQEKMALYAPTHVCVEQAFYSKNARTALVLGHARGVALLAAQQVGAQIAEFSPKEIKKAVVGNGNASKEQVHYMIQMLLAPSKKHDKLDPYDALAAALCGYYHSGTLAKMAEKAGASV